MKLAGIILSALSALLAVAKSILSLIKCIQQMKTAQAVA